MHGGYIKFWRKAQDSSSWNRGLMYQGLIINLLTRAAWKKSSYQGRDLFPGQFGAVMSHLAESLGVPRTTLQRMVAHLEADGLLTVENVGNRFIVITIVNWHVYQSTEEGEWATNGQPMGDQRATNGQPICESDDKNSKNSDLSSSFEPYNVEEGKKVRKKKVSKARAGASGSVPSFDELVSAYTRNQDLKIALGEFIVMRKASKKAFTNAALTHTFRELDKLAGAEDAAKIAILNQSVQRGWLGIFPLKDNRMPGNRLGMSAHGNTAGGQERDYGQSVIPDLPRARVGGTA